MSPLELNMEVQEMPAEGTCFKCGAVIEGKMFQYFLFAGTLEATPTKFKYCEPCYNEE